MRVQIGAGPKPIPGWENLDCREVDGCRVAHAGALPHEDGTVELLFGNAFFEHLFLAQIPSVLAEWRRVLSPTGRAVIIGIPDFAEVARCYLDGERGVIGPTFDALEAYRYVVGCPEADTKVDWPGWNPAEHPDEAPVEWLPQLHKCIFDRDVVTSFLEEADLPGTVFTYNYIGEEYPLNLGFVAGHDHADVRAVLNQIPTIGEYAELDTVEIADGRGGAPLVNLALLHRDLGPDAP